MPVTVEVVAYAPTEFYHCTHCEVVWHEVGVGQPVHREQLQAALPDDLRQDYERLAEWVHSIVERFGPQLAIKVIDAASIEGFYKSLRYGARKYPAIIIDGQDKVVGGDYERATALLAGRLGSPAGAGEKGGDV